MGPAGPVGPIGPAGPAGMTGASGTAGPAGPVGMTGAQGPAGPAGSAGPKGADGALGATGPAGPKGDIGPQGQPGQVGSPGPAGAQGPAGPMGSSAAFRLKNATTFVQSNSMVTALLTGTATPPSNGYLLVNAAIYCYSEFNTNSLEVGLSSQANSTSDVGANNDSAGSYADVWMDGNNRHYHLSVQQVFSVTAGVRKTIYLNVGNPYGGDVGPYGFMCTSSMALQFEPTAALLPL